MDPAHRPGIGAGSQIVAGLELSHLRAAAMPPAVRIENLSKLYRIGIRHQARYRTLRESLSDVATSPLRRWHALRNRSRFAPHELNGNTANHPQSAKSAQVNGAHQNGAFCTASHTVAGEARQDAPADTFWALNDVSFNAEYGEVVGIIGRNGAGKSTLLKILSRITEPTRGRVVLNGRVASLLEVGTGFHPELTGRENIYLNGAILGMHRHEIKRKFDAITEFSGVEAFLDTPVKRYSSGMYVRLAFAVAAHLDPEILIVDEVLAVGDAEFQKKCLARMSAIRSAGRSVFFVSHNLAAVRNLCSSVVVLERGQIAYSGGCDEGTTEYLKLTSGSQDDAASLVDLSNGRLIRRIVLRSVNGTETRHISSGDPLVVDLLFQSQYPSQMLNFELICLNSSRSALFKVGTLLSKSGPITVKGESVVTCRVDELPLCPGDYTLVLNVGIPYSSIIETHDPAIRFKVIGSDYYGNGRMPTGVDGDFIMRSDWSTEPLALINQ